tara:strand:- start:102 stop:1106 length:1005 start_codon:yes stop_codon:yes gene_type:complete
MKTYIIAEIGINHNGNMNLAKKMIKLAARTGADGVKFQLYDTDNLLIKTTPKTEYQKKNTSKKINIYKILKQCQLSEKNLKDLKVECKKHKIDFLSSVFDLKSLETLKKIGTKFFKLPSGEINNYPLIKSISKIKKKKIILSTGMASINDITNCMRILKNGRCKKQDISILHCSTDYPAKFKDLNLKAINLIRQKFKTNVGYSDHSNGIEASIAAVVLGAKIIEKHFTLSKTMNGPDHKASLSFREFRYMVSCIRNIEIGIGKKIKKISQTEKKNSSIVRKSIVASREIFKGERFSENNISTKRPGTGISPMKWKSIIGRKAKKKFKKDQLISI